MPATGKSSENKLSTGTERFADEIGELILENEGITKATLRSFITVVEKKAKEGLRQRDKPDKSKPTQPAGKICVHFYEFVNN
jgi:hypothetical protein